MKHSLKIAGAAAAGALLLAATPVEAGHGVAEQTIPLSSGQETGRGERGGSGKITLEFYNQGGGYGLDDTTHICYDLTTKKVGTQTGLHIHEAGRKTAGDVVLSLGGAAFMNGEGEPCVPVDSALFNELLASPTDYYVNYHTEAAPAGAIRGQLHRFGG